MSVDLEPLHAQPTADVDAERLCITEAENPERVRRDIGLQHPEAALRIDADAFREADGEARAPTEAEEGEGARVRCGLPVRGVGERELALAVEHQPPEQLVSELDVHPRSRRRDLAELAQEADGSDRGVEDERLLVRRRRWSFRRWRVQLLAACPSRVLGEIDPRALLRKAGAARGGLRRRRGLVRARDRCDREQRRGQHRRELTCRATYRGPTQHAHRARRYHQRKFCTLQIAPRAVTKTPHAAFVYCLLAMLS